MSLITTGSVAKALMPGVNKWFGLSYDEHPIQYSDIFNMEMSAKNFEEDVNHYGLALASVKPEGQKLDYDEMAQGFLKRYIHVTYGLGFIISREAVEDNQYLELAEKRAKALAFSMRQTKENVAANVLNRAFTAGYVGADGVVLCSTAHVRSRDASTFANKPASDVDLSEAAIEQACIDIMDTKNDAGLRVALMADKLIVPTALKFEAERILKSTLQNDTNNNALNALRSTGMLPGGVSVNNYLTDADAWFIKTNCPEGLKGFQRRALEVRDDTDFDSENVKFKATERYSFGWTDPRGIYGSAGA